MTARALPDVATAVASVTFSDCQRLAQLALGAESADEALSLRRAPSCRARRAGALTPGVPAGEEERERLRNQRSPSPDTPDMSIPRFVAALRDPRGTRRNRFGVCRLTS